MPFTHSAVVERHPRNVDETVGSGWSGALRELRQVEVGCEMDDVHQPLEIVADAALKVVGIDGGTLLDLRPGRSDRPRLVSHLHPGLASRSRWRCGRFPSANPDGMLPALVFHLCLQKRGAPASRRGPASETSYLQTFLAMCHLCSVLSALAAVVVLDSIFYVEGGEVQRDVLGKPSSPPEPPMDTCVTMMSSRSTVEVSSGLSPALRTISLPLLMCLPLQQMLKTTSGSTCRCTW